jgi:S-sulfosulfanyl-L-cysteine sulfohydrolase
MVNGTSRRNFLRYSTLAGLGLTLNPFSSYVHMERDVLPSNCNDDLKDWQQRVTILQSTDVHCQLHPHDEMFWENDQMVFRTTGGYAHLATFFRQMRLNNPNTFIIDTGDMFQGSQLSVETTGKAIQPILNAIGYDLYLPGNWEVVYYKKAMQQLLGGLSAPKICANMYHDIGDGRKGELIFPPYYTWSAAGIKIGFVGYTDPLVPIRQSPAYSKGIIYTKPEENLEHYVSVLREQEQCNMVILLSHLGLSQQIALSNSNACKGVDYIFGGDTHERVRTPIHGKYSKVVEPGAFGSFVGKLDLIVENGEIINERYDLIEINSKSYAPDNIVESTIQKNEGTFKEKMNQLVGYSKVPLYRYFVVENTIDTLIIDALKWKVGTDIVLSNGFRFCPPNNTRDNTGNIPITEGYLFDMLPVDAQVRTGKVSGAQIIAWLEKELNNVFATDATQRIGGWMVKFKGMKVEFKAFVEFGKRVQSVLINDVPLNNDTLYSVCACEREGDPPDMLCRMTDVTDARNTNYSLHRVLKDYLKVNSPVAPLPEMNAVILDASKDMLSQVSGVDYQFS